MYSKCSIQTFLRINDFKNYLCNPANLFFLDKTAKSYSYMKFVMRKQPLTFFYNCTKFNLK